MSSGWRAWLSHGARERHGQAGGFPHSKTSQIMFTLDFHASNCLFQLFLYPFKQESFPNTTPKNSKQTKTIVVFCSTGTPSISTWWAPSSTVSSRTARCTGASSAPSRCTAPPRRGCRGTWPSTSAAAPTTWKMAMRTLEDADFCHGYDKWPSESLSIAVFCIVSVGTWCYILIHFVMFDSCWKERRWPTGIFNIFWFFCWFFTR